jgi:hypothetical protein
VNRLEQMRATLLARDLDFALHDQLVAEFARLNGCKATKRGFALSTLARGGVTDTVSGTWGNWPLGYPGADHHAFARRGRYAAMAIVEPYDSEESRVGLPAYLAARGLVLHQPPNPQASFWYPGATLFCVITTPEFGEVKWLEEQLQYKFRESQT